MRMNEYTHNHLAEALQGAGRTILEMVWVQREAQHAASLGERSQYLVRLVAQRRVPPGRVGVGNSDRATGRFDGL